VAPLPVAEKVSEPVADKPAPAVEQAVAKPSIDRSVVSAVVGSHRGEILKCFADGKKTKPDMKGSVNVTLSVTPDGNVSRPQVQSSLGAPLVAACVAKAVASWKFPARQGTGLAVVSYPFTLN
jgi:hypothetical protein